MKLISSKTVVTKIKTEKYEITKDLILVKKYKNGKFFDVILEGLGPHKTSPFLVKPSFFEYIKTTNPFHEGVDKHLIDLKKSTDLDIINAIKNKHVMFFYGSGHVAFDIDHNPVPLIYPFNYIGTHFSSRNTNQLDKMMAHLKKHKWMINPDNLKIEDIPYYNQSDDDRYGIEKYISGIVLRPSKKEFIEMYKLSLDTKNADQSWSVRLHELVKSYCWEHPTYDGLKIHKFLKEDNFFYPGNPQQQNYLKQLQKEKSKVKSKK